MFGINHDCELLQSCIYRFPYYVNWDSDKYHTLLVLNILKKWTNAFSYNFKMLVFLMTSSVKYVLNDDCTKHYYQITINIYVRKWLFSLSTVLLTVGFVLISRTQLDLFHLLLLFTIPIDLFACWYFYVHIIGINSVGIN